MDLEPRVFIIQEQQRWDEGSKRLVPKFDVSSARIFGTLEYLLTPTAHPFNPDPIITELEKKLQNFTCEDFLLLIGNPVLIGISCIIAARQAHGAVQLLQWSGKEQRYTKIDLQICMSLEGAYGTTN